MAFQGPTLQKRVEKPKRDALDLIKEGLGIAQQVYGIRSNMQALETGQARLAESEASQKLSAAQSESLARRERGQILPSEVGQLGFAPAPQGAKNTVGIQVIGPEGKPGLQQFITSAQLKEQGLTERTKIAEKGAAQRQEMNLSAEEKTSLLKQQQKQLETLAKVNPTVKERQLKLNSTQQGDFSNAIMALKGIRDMKVALAQGQNTFTVFGENDFTMGQQMFIEAFGRIQTGAAITKDEAQAFKKFTPRSTMSSAQQSQILNKMAETMMQKLDTLGFNKQEVGSIISGAPLPTANIAASPDGKLTGAPKAAGIPSGGTPAGVAPGKVIKTKDGKSFLIGDDGDTLIELNFK